MRRNLGISRRSPLSSRPRRSSSLGWLDFTAPGYPSPPRMRASGGQSPCVTGFSTCAGKPSGERDGSPCQPALLRQRSRSWATLLGSITMRTTMACRRSRRIGRSAHLGCHIEMGINAHIREPLQRAGIPTTGDSEEETHTRPCSMAKRVAVVRELTPSLW